MGWYRELIERHQGEGDLPDTGLETDILAELRAQELEDATVADDEMAGDWDELFQAAAEVCIRNRTGSTSLLQRRLSIGYGRAARIVDQLFDAGVIGDSVGSKGREVLMSIDELEAFMHVGAVIDAFQESRGWPDWPCRSVGMGPQSALAQAVEPLSLARGDRRALRACDPLLCGLHAAPLRAAARR